MNLMFNKKQMVGITELQRNARSVSSKAKDYDVLILRNNVPFTVMLDYDRYEKLVEKAEQAEIYTMLSERKDSNIKWRTTKEVLEGLSLSTKGTGVPNEPTKRSKSNRPNLINRK